MTMIHRDLRHTRRAVEIAKDQSIETVKKEFRRQLTTLPEFFKKMCQIVGKASYTMNLDQEPVTSQLFTQDPVASQLIKIQYQFTQCCNSLIINLINLTPSLFQG